MDDGGTLAERAMVRLAGREALKLAGLLDASAELGCRRDLEEAQACALELAGGDKAKAERILAELRVKTSRLLFDRDRWREHGAVALAVLQRETLNRDELRRVLYAANLRSTVSRA
jgi:hypothetical protein